MLITNILVILMYKQYTCQFKKDEILIFWMFLTVVL
jgi:hypothetical protein